MGASGSRTVPLEPVKHVATEKLLGTWFVIAVMPTMFEKGAYNAVETYARLPTKPGGIDIDFSFNKDAFDGPLKSIPQKGSSWFDDKPGGWKVSPFWPVKMPYLVIDQSAKPLDDEDAYFVVGYPSRAYCWVLARKPEMDANVYDDVTRRLVSDHGYPEGLPDMVKVPHAWTRAKGTRFGWVKKAT